MLEKRMAMIIFLGLVISLILSGCTLNEGASQAKENKRELVLAVGSEPDAGFDPTTGWGRYGSPLFQSTLLKRDKDLNIVNDLATDYEVSADGKTWTVKLRQDAVFSDGTALTAADVQYTFETAASSGSTIDLSNLERVEATGTYEVRFQLEEPQSTFIHYLVTTGIVPRHAHSSDYAMNPIGSGPYRLVQWDQGQQLIVEANPEYYGDQPYFQKLTFLFLNEDAAFAAAKAGKVDVAYIPSAFSTQTVAGMRLEAVPTVDNRGIMFPYLPAGGKTEEGYPLGNDVTSDFGIRKAINIGIDRDALVEGVLEGYGTPAYTVNDGLPWYNPEAAIEDGNPEKAKEILAEGGWEDVDGDGILEKGELEAAFTLLYPADDVTRQSLAIASADMLESLGIHITVEGKSWDELEKLMHANAVLFGWGSHDPMEMYSLYSSKYRGIDLLNPGYYSNDKVEQYMSDALKATSEEEANELWKKAQWDGTTGLSARGDAPWAWLVNIDHLYLVKDDLDIGNQGIHPHGHGWPVTNNIEEWRWLAENEMEKE